jgi:hypothetical protein
VVQLKEEEDESCEDRMKRTEAYIGDAEPLEKADAPLLKYL